MVLWVSAALAAIGFSLATTVRGEAERTGTAVDSLRSYYLAIGGVQRAMVELLWSAEYPGERRIPKGATVVNYTFPSGLVRVEIIPEAGRLDVNHISVLELFRLLLALGEPQDRAREISAAIDDWRRPTEAGSMFDSFYLSQTPSFRSPHASFQEIEELLLVKGVTPDLFYGSYVPAEGLSGPDASGPRLVARGGLIDCLSVYGSVDRIDANTAAPAALSAVGLSPFAINALLERRARAPLTDKELPEFMAGLGAPSDRLRLEGFSIVTMRATAQLRLQNGQISDLKRTVGAQVKYLQPNANTSYNVLRWYDTAWSN
jgi:general secretion pathway protein K